MSLIPSTVKATRPFQVFDGAIQQGQVCGFWDPGTAVLYGHDSTLFGLAHVGLSQVIAGPTPAFGPCLHAVEIPGQSDPDLGPYGVPIPSTFIAFCPLGDTTAILVSAIIEQSSDNAFRVEGTKSAVVCHVLTRANVTSTAFTVSDETVIGTAWWWPDGAVDFGSGSPDDYAVLVMQAAAGSATDAVALGVLMTLPAPHPYAQYLGAITITGGSVMVDYTVGMVTPGPLGSQTAEGQVPLNNDGVWQLAGNASTGAPVINRSLAGGLAHSDPAKTFRPQIIGTYVPDGGAVAPARLAWAEISAGTLSFHSFSLDGSAPDVRYGPVLTLPTGVVGDLVAVDIAARCPNIAYVPVTLMVSTASRDGAGVLTGTAAAYGAVVDFRAEPLLRSDWVLLGSWDYHNGPGQPFLTVTAVRDNEVDLAWASVYPGAPASTLLYDIYQGSVLLTTTPDLAYTVTGLVEGTHYTFIAVAHDGAGNIGPVSEPLGLTTTAPDIPPDTTPPSAPTLSLVSKTSVSAIVRPDGSTDDVAVAFYRIFMTGHIVSGVLVDDVSSPEIPLSVRNNGDGTYTVDWETTDTGAGTHEPYFALDGVEHYYCARAYDLAGNESARSGFAQVKFRLDEVDHPSGTGTPTVTAHTTSSITLSFAEATEDGSPAGVVVDIYRNGTLHDTQAASLTTYSDTFPAGSQPHYQLQARDSAGNLSAMSPSVPDWSLL